AKVVKSVTGYDMNKLYIGSFGTLGIIVEATFRLYPMPGVEKTCLSSFESLEGARQALGRILDCPVVPSAVELLNPEAFLSVAGPLGLATPNGYALAVAIGSVRREPVDAQAGTVRELSTKAGGSSVDLLEGERHDLFWSATRDLEWDRDLHA